GGEHPPPGREEVDRDGHGRPRHLLEEEGGTAPLDRAVRDLRDLEDRRDLARDADELPPRLELADEVRQVLVSHRQPSRVNPFFSQLTTHNSQLITHNPQSSLKGTSASIRPTSRPRTLRTTGDRC